MVIGILIDFVLEQIVPELLLKGDFLGRISKYIRYIYYSKDLQNDDDVDDDDGFADDLSDMAEDIWFDGVDKKLIEAHSRKVVMVKGDDASLLTNTPLISYRGIMKKRKLANSDSQQAHLGHKSNDIVINIAPLNGNANSSTKSNKLSKESTTTMLSKAELSKYTLQPTTAITEEVALDCEMVECYGHKSVLARVSIVNLFGHPILDSYVTPPDKVTDYRTRYSGIRRSDLEDAPSFDTVQAQVSRIIKDRIVVGHAIHNDFTALKLSHPSDKTRDTSHYFGRNYFLGKTPSLKKLCQSILGVAIQKGEHDSVQDAQATMKLYVRVREKWNDGCLKIQHSGKQKVKKQKTKPQKKKIKAFFVETL